MSGTPPYIYLELNGSLVGMGLDALLYMYDATNIYLIMVDGVDLFEAGCVTAKASNDTGQEHPVGAWNISYPYCRTALRFRMDDPRGNPQLGQLVIQAPYVSIKVLLEGCDKRLPISVQMTSIEPPLTNVCAAELYPGYQPDEFYLLVDSLGLSLPSRYTFTITNGSVVREFWVGLRDSRGGTPSGAIVGARV